MSGRCLEGALKDLEEVCLVFQNAFERVLEKAARGLKKVSGMF